MRLAAHSPWDCKELDMTEHSLMQWIKILVSDPHQHLHCLKKKNYYSHSSVEWLFIMVLILLIVIRNY